MQAIGETVFDVIYLSTVITLGIIMMTKSKGQKEFFLFGVMAVTLSGERHSQNYNCGVCIGRNPNCPVLLPAKQMAQCRCTGYLGRLSEYSLCAAWPFDDSSVLSECSGES